MNLVQTNILIKTILFRVVFFGPSVAGREKRGRGGDGGQMGARVYFKTANAIANKLTLDYVHRNANDYNYFDYNTIRLSLCDLLAKSS